MSEGTKATGRNFRKQIQAVWWRKKHAKIPDGVAFPSRDQSSDDEAVANAAAQREDVSFLPWQTPESGWWVAVGCFWPTGAPGNELDSRSAHETLKVVEELKIQILSRYKT